MSIQIGISTLPQNIQTRLVKVMRALDIARANHPDSELGKAASAILLPLYAELDALSAPHLDHIDWTA